MKGGTKIFLILLVIGGLVGAGVAYYMYNKPHENVVDSTPVHTYTATDLTAELARDTATLKQKIAGQIIQVTGTVRLVSSDHAGGAVIQMEAGNYGLNDVSLQMDAAFMDSTVLNIPAGQEISVKGIYNGHQYEDALESWTVYLNRCVLVK
ncbi:hypothetical protein BH09BAC1_BH09BAC1_24160 [soil metagenome]